MANSLTSFTPQMWSARVQVLLKNNLVGGAIANTEERATLEYGSRVHRPYHSEVYSQSYTKGTAVTMLDVSTTDEYLDVDQVRVVPLYVDDVDKIQNKYRTIDILSERAAYEMRDVIDRKVLAEVANAGLGNTTAWSLSTSNIVQAISEAKASLFNNGCEESKPWYIIMDPDTVSVVEQYFASNGFKRQDETLDNGYGIASYLGDWLGLKCFKSQNNPTAATVGIATTPTDGDTVVINGVTFTFKTSLGTTAGNVLIDGSAANACTNLAALINDPGTTTANGYALSAANQAKIKRRGIVATAAATSVALTAAGKMTLSETLSAVADVWGTQTMKMMMGQMGNTDLVLQQDVNAKFLIPTDKLGTNILTWALYGTKTFVEGAQRMYALYKNC